MPRRYTTGLPIHRRPMTFDFTPLAALSGIAALISTAIAAIAWYRRQFPGVRWLALLMSSVAFWAAGAMCELAAASLSAKIAWSKLEYLGTLSTPVLFLLLALDYNRIQLSRRWLAALFALPLLCFVLALSNESHHLVWTSYRPSPSGYNLLVYGHGPAFWVGVAGYSYLMMLIGSLMLIRALHYYPAHFRGQSIVLMASACAPWLGNILYLSSAMPLQGLDPTPLAFTITGLVFALDLLYLRLLYLVPVARARSFEAMGDGVLVIDDKFRILDLNPAAARLLGRPSRLLLGQALPADWPREQILKGRDASLELSLQDGARILDLRVYPIAHHPQPHSSRMLVARDITERRRAEEALRGANQTLALRIAEIEALQAALREQALRDPLTGLYNRRYLDDTFARELSRARSEGAPLSIALIDLDDFKRINDSFGHYFGDEVLRRLSALLAEDGHHGDILCRLGGEEFLVLMPGADGEQALRRAETWRAAFQRLPHGAGDDSFCATFSCGLAAFPLHADSPASLYQAADRALYAVKAGGKNACRLSAAL
ncbi:histidine kinase N-terminal 7TM domain-containing diguanylate cyclase [Chromobacterium haemolyticum]|uniref:histidine kinase N-terminal 7TM domain-containing diguanylate cyclase n=1 Tax=Chromobacterium haemolyticum TaxID=394935 RepID=UPI0009E00250|nr:histidine kinase N-terminal 7TM domain-containing protein [Chromobacterium haemolyticum]QOD81817.1 diguanylate cyclase [Chromobacterium haemolyticum]